MKEGESDYVEWHEEDQPDGETFSILKFAAATSRAAYLPEWQKDIEYLKSLQKMPANYKTFVEHERARIAAKWKSEDEQPCQQQPKRRKPRNYTNYDVGGEDE